MILHSKIEGEGKPFVILHGFLGMLDNWKTLSTEFAAAGFQVHALDLRNHGKSFHSNDFNYEVMVEDVKRYCEFHQLDQILLLGHSMGGKVAMQFACLYPEKVEKLIVADIGPKYYPQHHQTILVGLSAIDFSKKPSRQEADETLASYIKDVGTRQFLLKSLHWESPGQLAFRFNLKVFVEKIEAVGKALSEEFQYDKPTLFLRGDKSNYILDSDWDAIQLQFPNAQLETISNAGHWLHAENPQEFYSNVIQFIK